jgi:hypothetical protein
MVRQQKWFLYSSQGYEMNKIQTSGAYDGECYTINVAFNDFHVMTLDGLSREDLFELASCITVLMPQDDFNKLTMENTDGNV